MPAAGAGKRGWLLGVAAGVEDMLVLNRVVTSKYCRKLRDDADPLLLEMPSRYKVLPGFCHIGFGCSSFACRIPLSLADDGATGEAGLVT